MLRPDEAIWHYGTYKATRRQRLSYFIPPHSLFSFFGSLSSVPSGSRPRAKPLLRVSPPISIITLCTVFAAMLNGGAVERA